MTCLRKLFLEGSFDPEDLLEAILDNIHRKEKKIHAYLHLVDESIVREQARRAAREIKHHGSALTQKKVLLGLPIAVKDNTDVTGMPCTGGSRIFEGRIPERDSNIASRLRAAGSTFLGKTNLDELAAFGIATNNPHYGRTLNPWDLGRIPGGSSGGSAAAVASGEAVASTGSDTGGSVRIPAAFCNLVGLKATFGLIGTSGTFSMCWSLDHIGFIARTVRDAALLLEVASGYDPSDSFSSNREPTHYAFSDQRDLSGTKIGVFENPIRSSSEGVKKSFEDSLSKFSELGAKITSILLPDIDHITPTIFAIALPEVSSYHEHWFRTKRDLYGKTLLQYVQLGHAVLATEYLKAQRAKTLITRKVSEKLREVDALIVPTAPSIAPRLDQDTIRIGDKDYPAFQVLSENTYPFNLLGLPAMSIPCGFSEGMPVGLQLVGPHFGEGVIFRIGDAFQQVTDYHLKKPAGLD